MHHQQLKNRRGLLGTQVLAALAGAALAAPTAHGALVVDLPEVIVYSDGVNPVSGVFEVTLTLTGAELTAPPAVSSFNLDFSVAGSQVFLGAPATPPGELAPLFVGGDFASLSSGNVVKASHDIFDQSPSSVTAFNGAMLVQVPYTVTPGLFAAYPLSFGALNQITNDVASPLPVTLVGGSILVTMVPEAAGWKAWTLVGGAVWAVAIAARRRRTLAA